MIVHVVGRRGRTGFGERLGCVVLANETPYLNSVLLDLLEDSLPLRPPTPRSPSRRWRPCPPEARESHTIAAVFSVITSTANTIARFKSSKGVKPIRIAAEYGLHYFIYDPERARQ
jgi:hypothetical protein